jgi:hypothetical protein
MDKIIALSLILLIPTGCSEKKAGYDKEDAENLIEILKEKKAENIELSEAIKNEMEVLEKNLELAESDGLKEKFKTELSYKKIAFEKLNFAIANEDSAMAKIYQELDTLKK